MCGKLGECIIEVCCSAAKSTDPLPEKDNDDDERGDVAPPSVGSDAAYAVQHRRVTMLRAGWD